MRTFDLWSRYLDNDNHPLHGCIHFVVNDGNTSAPIYDKDGTALDNPQLTDIYGRTQHQVFINEDVIAYYYKYIGNGQWYTEMNIDPSDTSKWQLQYTSKSEMFIDIENDSKASYAVLNIEDLRDLNPTSVPSIDGVKIVTLMGYNEAGDKEPINYIWDANSTDADDGGSIIATDLIKGRWIMVCPTEHLDVRHFGVFPSNSQNMVDQTLSVQSALTYANNHGLRLFFDTKYDVQYYHYYKLTNITLNAIQTIDLAKGVEFIDDDLTISTSQSKAFNSDPYFINGDTNLHSNFAKSSWNIKSLTKSKLNEEATFIIDDSTHSTNVKTLQGWNVNTEANISGYTFVQCNVYGSGLITSTAFTTCRMNMKGTLGDSNTYTNCYLDEYMFNGSPTITSVTNCTVDIDDFTHKVNLWNNLNFHMGTYKDIDFKNVTIPTDFVIWNQDLGDRTYSNFIGTGTSHTFGESSTQHVYRFNNVQGNIRIPGNANNTYVFDNCSVNLTFGITTPACTIVIRDSEVVLNSNLPNATLMIYSSTASLNSNYANVSVKDSTIAGLASSTRLNTANFSAFSSILNQEVSSANMVIKDSQINKDFYSVNNGTSITGYIDNCIWNDVQQHISSDTTDTTYTGAWINNNATKANPIVFDMTNLKNNDGAHRYVYRGNTGTFLPREYYHQWIQRGVYTINYTDWYYYHLNRPELFNVPCIIRDDSRKSAGPGDNAWAYNSVGMWIPSTYNWNNQTIKFFSIGTKRMRVDLQISAPFDNAVMINHYISNTYYANYFFTSSTYFGFDGMNFSGLDLSNEMIAGPNYIPYSSDNFCYGGTADVPYTSGGNPAIPPSTATGYESFDMTLTLRPVIEDGYN